MPKPEEIDDTDIELVYNHFKNDLGSINVKFLNEAMCFKIEFAVIAQCGYQMAPIFPVCRHIGALLIDDDQL
jgi:hypothetical protein